MIVKGKNPTTTKKQQHKIKCSHKSFARTLQKVNGAEQYIKKRIEELCRGKNY